MQNRLHEHERRMLTEDLFSGLRVHHSKGKGCFAMGGIPNRRAVLLLAACRMLIPTGRS
jgi:hypothetical protein